MVLLLLSNCGTTLLVADRPTQEIFVNGVYKGKGVVKIQRAGVYSSKTIVAKQRDKIVGQTNISRNFDLTTLIVGYLSFGVGLVTYWRFPGIVKIPVENPIFKKDLNVSPRNPINKSINRFVNHNIWLDPPVIWGDSIK